VAWEGGQLEEELGLKERTAADKLAGLGREFLE